MLATEFACFSFAPSVCRAVDADKVDDDDDDKT